MDKQVLELAKNIGKFLKSANDLKFHYYESQDRIDSMPREKSIAEECVNIFFRDPERAIAIVEKKSYPFKQFCLSRIKHRRDHDKKSVFTLSRFNKLLEIVKKDVSIVDKNNVSFQNLILLGILK